MMAVHRPETAISLASTGPNPAPRRISSARSVTCMAASDCFSPFISNWGAAGCARRTRTRDLSMFRS